MEHEALRAEVEAAVQAEVNRVGSVMINRGAIWTAFQGRGASRATVYRWVAAVLPDIAPGRDKVTVPPIPHQAPAPKDTARAIRMFAVEPGPEPDPEPSPPPPPPRAEMAATFSGPMPGGLSMPVIAHLQGILEDVQRVRATAFTADGQLRNGRMLLRVSEEMRRLMETVVKLQAAMHDIAGLERFHRAIIDAIREESPELAERVLKRLDDLAARWGG